MKQFAVFFTGVVFSSGLMLSGMTNPMKVLNFMDLAGLFDPTLIFVMGAALLVTLIGYRLAFGKSRPMLSEKFELPKNGTIDNSLFGGSALFGIGWGLTGFCPGPAIASLVFGHLESLAFVAAMTAGMLAANWAKART